MYGLVITDEEEEAEEESEKKEGMSRETGEEGMVPGEPQTASDELCFQLRCVFDACDTGGTGLISLRELANISRSHVGDSGQLDQVLDILDSQGKGMEDQLNFDQFYNKFVSFMRAGAEENRDRVVDNVTTARDINDQGIFNENLRRSFDKANSKSAVSSPYKSPTKKLQRRNSRRKNSQARLSGRIPLVNTSSEDDDLEDSFDRKIAASLEAARPLVVEQKFLVRGVATRNTIRKTSSSSPLAGSSFSPARSTSSNRKFSSPAPGSRMSPILRVSDSMSSSSSHSCSTPSTRSGHGSPARPLVSSDTRLVLQELERKVGELQGTAAERRMEVEYDSPSSGVGSLKVELEEEISSSVQLARQYGEERLAAERQRHMEEVAALERERDLERRNFHLRFEQMRLEQDKMRGEVDQLREKVRMVNLEKEHCEEQISTMAEVPRNVSSNLVELVTTREQEGVNIREQELLLSFNQLTAKVEAQDSQLAETKEDNIVLRSQNKALKEVLEAGRGKENTFRGIFGGRESPPLLEGDLWEDPADIRARLRGVEEELGEQREVNKQLKAYVGEVLANIMMENPQILEKK